MLRHQIYLKPLFIKNMTKTNFPKSSRKFIRKEKARIRRQTFDSKEQEKQIQGLYLVKNPSPKDTAKFNKKLKNKTHESKRNS